MRGSPISLQDVANRLLRQSGPGKVAALQETKTSLSGAYIVDTMKEAALGELEVHLSDSFISGMIILGLMSFGILAPALWRSARMWPRSLNQEGIRLRNEKRVFWKDITGLRRVTVGSHIVPRYSRIDLTFGRTTVRIVSGSLAEGFEVLDYLAAVFGSEYSRKRWRSRGRAADAGAAT